MGVKGSRFRWNRSIGRPRNKRKPGDCCFKSVDQIIKSRNQSDSGIFVRLSWLLSGIGGLFLMATIYSYGYLSELVLPLSVICLLFAASGALLLFSPNIRLYSQMMRS